MSEKLVKALEGMLEAWEEQFGAGSCDCRKEPENTGHVCQCCIARSALLAHRAETQEVEYRDMIHDKDVVQAGDQYQTWSWVPTESVGMTYTHSHKPHRRPIRKDAQPKAPQHWYPDQPHPFKSQDRACNVCGRGETHEVHRKDAR